MTRTFKYYLCNNFSVLSNFLFYFSVKYSFKNSNIEYKFIYQSEKRTSINLKFLKLGLVSRFDGAAILVDATVVKYCDSLPNQLAQRQVGELIPVVLGCARAVGERAQVGDVSKTVEMNKNS